MNEIKCPHCGEVFKVDASGYADIVKQVRDLIDGVYSEKSSKAAQQQDMQRAWAEDVSEKDLSKEIKKLEKQMLEHAKNLEFEQAARTRDQLAALRERVLGAAGRDALV